MMVSLELGFFPFKKTWVLFQCVHPCLLIPLNTSLPYFPTSRLIPYIIGSFLLICEGYKWWTKNYATWSIVCSFQNLRNVFNGIILKMSLHKDHQTCPSPSLALAPLISDPKLLHAQILFFFRKKEGNVWSPCLLLGYTSDGFNHPWVISSHPIHLSFSTPVHSVFHFSVSFIQSAW